MKDRELLEAAAKVAGYEIYTDCIGKLHRKSAEYDGEFNPLVNDDDAFRLMVDCCIEVAIYSDAVAAAKKGNLAANEIFHYDVDRYAATRRAIVRAAAGE